MANQLSDIQVAQYGYNAGFRGDTLVRAVAVALAESGGIPANQNTNTNGSVDRGLWQINSVHSQYDYAKLYDPQYNANAAWQISNQGQNWHPWTTFNTGAYLQFIPRAVKAVNSLGDKAVQGAISFSEDVLNKLKSFYSAPVTQGFGPTSLGLEPSYGGVAHFHMGVDLGEPQGTALPSLSDGRVSNTIRGCSPGDFSCGSGYGNQVEVTLNDGSKFLYGHLSNVNVSIGETISAGQILGATGNTGASTGPHVHIMLKNPDGSQADPTPYINAARSGDVSILSKITKGITGASKAGADAIKGVLGAMFGGGSEAVEQAFNAVTDWKDALVGVAKIIGNITSYFTDAEKRPILLFIGLGVTLTWVGLRSMANKNPAVKLAKQATIDPIVNTGKRASKVAELAALA